MSPTALLVVYCVLILLASLAGGWIPMLVKLTHKRMEIAVSFVAGVMLGVGLLHMLPHALELRLDAAESHGHVHSSLNPVMLWLLGGFLTMFFIERFFCFHHHEVSEAPGETSHVHDHDCKDHLHDHAHEHRHSHTWAGTAIGLTLHSLIDGVALAASVQAAQHAGNHDGHVHAPAALAGLGTFIVVLLHKPFDSLTLGTMMALGQRSPMMRHVINAGFSLMVVVGVMLFQFGLMSGSDSSGVVSAALAFSAGTFLCIAMSDLLPELQFHQHDRGKLSASLLLGLGVAWGVGALESAMH